MQQGKYSSADVATPETSEQASAPEQANALAYNPGEGKEGGYAEKLRPVGNIGRTALSDFTSIPGQIKGAFQHPVESGMSLAQGIINPTAGIGQSAINSYKEGGLEKAFTDTAGHLLSAGLTEGALRGLHAGGAPMERAGEGVLNHAMDVTPKMMKYGQNPARGVVNEGLTPSISKFSLGNKLEKALPQAGEKVSNAVGSASPIASGDIAKSIESPINETKAVMRGPGGVGSTGSLDTLLESMTHKAPGAGRSIYGTGAGTPFQPNEVVSAMNKTPKGLPAPKYDIPLQGEMNIGGTPSKPITLYSPSRSGPLGLPGPSGSTPMSSLNKIFPEQLPSGTSSVRLSPFGEPAEGLHQGESVGQIAGERGGIAPPEGVVRLPKAFPPSNEPSQFSDMRHPVSSANDVWKTIQNIDKNTRFNPDPEVEGVNEVRRDIRGGLRSNLEASNPEIKPTSQHYGDLKTAQDALERSQGKGTPLKGLKDMFGFPLETGAGTTMVRGGRSLSRIPTKSPLSFTRSAYSSKENK